MNYLIVVKEDSAKGISVLIESLKKVDSNTFLPFFIQPYEALVSHSSTLLFSKPILFTDYIFDLTSASIPSPYTLQDDEIRALTPWIRNSLYLNPYFYGRSFFNDIGYDDLIVYLNITFYFYLLVLEKFKPNIVFDIESENILRPLLELACNRSNILYCVAYNTRINQQHLFAQGVFSPFSKSLSISSSSRWTRQGITRIDLLAQLKNLDVDEKKFDKKNSSISVFSLVSSLIYQFIYHLRRIYRLSSFKVPGSKGYRSLLIGAEFSYLKFLVLKAARSYSNSIYSSPKSKKFLESFKERSYFLFPLGQIVEGAEPSLSNEFFNDIECLLSAYKIIPSNVDLLVKDHRSMITERPLFQRNLLHHSDLIYLFGKDLIAANMMILPSEFVSCSCGVLCLSGSTIIEAMLLGKPVYIFGDPWVRHCLRHLDFDPWSHPDSLSKFFESPDLFIVPDHLVDQVIHLSSSCANRMSLFSIKRHSSNNNTCQDISMLAELVSSCLS